MLSHSWHSPAVRVTLSAALLAWYDRHRRRLPWRAERGAAADPYTVWLSEVMLQQTTVAAVGPRFESFRARWPSFAALAVADDAAVMSAWAGLGYYARARNMLACARAVAAEHGGVLPDTESALRQLPGVGDYTAAAIAAIAFGRRAAVVDGNVERVVSRLFAIGEPLPGARTAIKARVAELTPAERPGDYAQATMDLGAMICTPRRPACALCPVAEWCVARATGEQERYPVKPTKRERPRRYGTAYWLEDESRVLLVRRPATGLLGGMRALPTGPWEDAPPGLVGAPSDADWELLARRGVEHGFTHFHLTLALAQATGTSDMAGEWWPVGELGSAGLPTVFRRAAEAFVEELGVVE